MAFAILADNDRKHGNSYASPPSLLDWGEVCLDGHELRLLGRERAAKKLRLCEWPVVLKRRNHLARFGDPPNVDTGAGDSDAFTGIREHLAPGIDDE
jgi:hypothetical protein